MKQESLFVKSDEHQLHVRHIYQQEGGTPILMLHGTIENGKIFYTQSGKGLACYLAKQGFDVYVPDLRGKGLSIPTLHETTEHGQHEMIVADIPSLVKFVAEKTGKPMHVICHSWGGVVFCSSFARFPDLHSHVLKLVCFGTKRSVYRKTFNKFWKVDVLFNRIAPFLAKRKGFIDAVKLKFGADNETSRFLKECTYWVKINPWHDPVDQFEYGNAANSIEWPDTWHLTGVNDDLLGHIDDVKAFVEETNPAAKVSLLSKQAGNLKDYDHIDILTDANAVQDHFPELVSWLNK
ncbi:alpha/beta fold hydrolase [Thalassotalea hakodatensis]|uniref:alpha/beta fold hydrolase n=1 Tax=Thalassotalea hakodatensis TaxID=3030492 RepID=UPI002572D993|nr:alpha/beta fold hydrolase [Thalassotalea hakodatensis]